MRTCLFYLHALTPLHVGNGQGDGIIDLPIAREAASGLPLVPGSGIKGVLRYHLDGPEGMSRDDLLTVFGPKPGNAAEHQGALSVGDARLLCLPVRSLAGTFAWVSCPLVLQRFRRDMVDAGVDAPGTTVPLLGNEARVLVASTDILTIGQDGDRIYLEELALEVEKDQASAASWARFIAGQVFQGDKSWQKTFMSRFVVVSDAVFDLLCQRSMEIRARISLHEETRTVKQGPWYEENLPAESLLWGLLSMDRGRRPIREQEGQAQTGDTRVSYTCKETLMKKLPQKPLRLQIGGNATVGRGQTRWLHTGVVGQSGDPQ